MKNKIMPMRNLIREIGAKEVSSTSLFTSAGTPDTEGLMSGAIFGLNQEDRRDLTGYIDLKAKYIHPLIYKRVLKRGCKDIDNLISGAVKYKISDKGELVPSDSGGTGLKFFYDNYDKIKFKNINVELDSKDDELELSLLKQDIRKLLKANDKDSIFIDKWLIIAVAFRDIDMAGAASNKMGIDELNGMYRTLINKINVVEDNKDTALFDINYMKYQVQMCIVQIFEYFKGILFGKYGIQRKRVMSKNVDFGTRIVITPPDFQGDSFNSQVIGMDRCGLPLSSVTANCYLFLGRKIRTYLSSLNMIDAKGAPFSGEDKEIYYNSKKVNGYRDTFVYSWGERLTPILAPDDKTPVTFTYTDSDGKVRTRNLCITDLMYMFAYTEIELTDKHTMSTRHPVMDSFNVIPSKIHVLSTLKTKAITIDGIEYPHYPDLDYIFDRFDISTVEGSIEAEKELSGYFIEAKKISSLHLSGLNGDFDGDKMIERIIFSDEANEEIDNMMNKMTYVFDTSLKNMKSLGNDAQQAMYSFTSNGTGKYENAPVEIMDKLILAKSEDITMSFLFKEIRLADTTKFKKLVDIHDICNFQKSKVPEGERSDIRFDDNGTEVIFNGNCTVGQLILYKLLFHDLKIPLINEPMTTKNIRGVFDVLGRKILNKEITLDEFKTMLNKYENFTMRIGTFCNPSISSDMMVLTDDILELKAKLIEENKEALANDDLVALAKVEKQLISAVSKEFENNPASEMFSAASNYGNQFKTMAIMVGALPQDDSFNKFKVSTNSLNDGLKKSELVYAANAATVGAYSRGKAPEEGGAMAKESNGIFQNVLLDKHGSDCGTKEMVEVTIVNPIKYIGRWVQEGGKLVQITQDNASGYSGRTIPMRSVLTCKSKNICSVCAGEELYGIYEIYDKPINHGLKLNKQQHELVQKRLKLSHDTSIKFSELDFGDYKESKKLLR